MQQITCPKCGSVSSKTLKSWHMKSPKGGHTLIVSMMLCRECGKKFRYVERM